MRMFPIGAVFKAANDDADRLYNAYDVDIAVVQGLVILN